MVCITLASRIQPGKLFLTSQIMYNFLACYRVNSDQSDIFFSSCGVNDFQIISTLLEITSCLGCRVRSVIVSCLKLIRMDKIGHEKLPMFLEKLKSKSRGAKGQSCSAMESKMGARVTTLHAGKGFSQVST